MVRPTEKNNGFPFLDILGYLKNTQKIPNLAKWDKSQPGNSQPSSLIGTCLTLPNLGFLWAFFKFPKISKNGNAKHQINLSPLDSAIGFPNTYPLDSDLSGWQRYLVFEQPGPGA